MTFAAPWFLLAGAVAALAVIALHFLARREPAPEPFPTARFIPETTRRVSARSIELSDRILLALRVLAIVAAALAFARPSVSTPRRGLVRIILADTSRSVGDTAEVARIVADLRQDGDRVVPITSLSAGLVAGIREARALRTEADSVALVLVSPLAREQFDAATLAIRATWPAGMTWRRVTPAGETPPSRTVQLRGAGDDPLRSTLALAGWTLGEDAPIRIVREPVLSAADSAWIERPGSEPSRPPRDSQSSETAMGRGDPVSYRLIHWPAAGGPGIDTAGAVATGRTVLVAAFARPVETLTGTPVAWWVDGAAAATEQPLGAGCLRRVAIPIAPTGDLALRPRTRDLVHDLLAPCGGSRDLRIADSGTVAALIGDGPAALATDRLLPAPHRGRIAPWLVALALALLVVEHRLRRRAP